MIFSASILERFVGNLFFPYNVLHSRLNALEYGELKDKLQAPVRNARQIVIRQSLSEQFLQEFGDQVARNPLYHLQEGMVCNFKFYLHMPIVCFMS